jgi:hypothetical protein
MINSDNYHVITKDPSETSNLHIIADSATNEFYKLNISFKLVKIDVGICEEVAPNNILGEIIALKKTAN